MAEQDALSGAKFGSNLYLTDFPVKIRVLTRDPMVYNDNFANTKYAFVVFNVDEQKVQILDKTSGFPRRFQEINSDPDFGGDIRGIDVKVTTNGKQGKETRYNITPLTPPAPLTEVQKQIIVDAAIDLEGIIKKHNPGALRLSEVNAGKKLGPANVDMPVEPNTTTSDDIVIEDIGDNPIDLNDIPF